MQLDDLMVLLERPEKVTADHLHDLQELVAYAPYCNAFQMLLLKVLYHTQSIRYAQELKKTVLYSYTPSTLHRLLHETPQSHQMSVRVVRHTGDYFDMVDTMQRSGTDMTSLQELADRLRIARQNISVAVPQHSQKSVVTISIERSHDTEVRLRKYIKEERYEDAIAILEQLHLNNSEKNSYFADQIRFLRQVVENKRAKRSRTTK